MFFVTLGIVVVVVILFLNFYFWFRQTLFAQVPFVWKKGLTSVNFDGRKEMLGHKMYGIFRGTQPVLVIADREIAREFYQTQRDHVRDQYFSCLGKICSAFLGSAVGTQHGRDWTIHRKGMKCMVQEPFLESHTPMILKEVREWMSEQLIPGEKFQVNKSIQYCSLAIIARFVFGDLSDEAFNELFEISDLHSELMNSLTKKILTQEEKEKLRQFQRRWTEFTQERLRNVSKGTVLDYILTNSSFDEKMLLDNLNELLLFNLDVMQSALGGLYYRLARERKEVSRLQLEINTRSAEEVLKDSSVMKKIQAFLLETARLNPSLSLTFPEQLSKSTILDGKRIPSGTVVVIDALSINDPKFDSFDSSRQKDKSPFTKDFHRFGLGTRSCLGARFAQRILEIILIETLRYYSFDRPRPSISEKQKGLAFFTPYLGFPDFQVHKLNLCSFRGKQWFSEGASVLCGLSIGNSYYKKHTVSYAVKYCKRNGINRFYPFIPNMAYMHTLRAMGKPEKKIKRRIRQDTRRIESWLKETDSSIIKPFNWSEVTKTSLFHDSKEKIDLLYQTDQNFQQEVNGLTLGAIIHGENVKDNFKERVEIGKNFLLEELAFLVVAPEILNEEKIVYIYHREWPIFDRLINGEYSYPKVEGVGRYLLVKT